jgi:hypothetical protein
MIVLKDVLALLEGELLTPAASPEAAFRTVFASDLMSDVLTSAEPGSPNQNWRTSGALMGAG